MIERIKRQAIRFELVTGSPPTEVHVHPKDFLGLPYRVDGVIVLIDARVPVGNVWVYA